jgi:hypothetical protein
MEIPKFGFHFLDQVPDHLFDGPGNVHDHGCAKSPARHAGPHWQPACGDQIHSRRRAINMSLDLGFQHNQKYEGGKSRTSNARLAPQPISARPRACFLRLANLYNGVFERLGRHESAPARQVTRILFLIKSARVS